MIPPHGSEHAIEVDRLRNGDGAEGVVAQTAGITRSINGRAGEPRS
jgi:hypothetical protein